MTKPSAVMIMIEPLLYTVVKGRSLADTKGKNNHSSRMPTIPERQDNSICSIVRSLKHNERQITKALWQNLPLK